jgi:hypothetical protein
MCTAASDSVFLSVGSQALRGCHRRVRLGTVNKAEPGSVCFTPQSQESQEEL